jgi:hypothetical protein
VTGADAWLSLGQWRYRCAKEAVKRVRSGVRSPPRALSPGARKGAAVPPPADEPTSPLASAGYLEEDSEAWLDEEGEREEGMRVEEPIIAAPSRAGPTSSSQAGQEEEEDSGEWLGWDRGREGSAPAAAPAPVPATGASSQVPLDQSGTYDDEDFVTEDEDEVEEEEGVMVAEDEEEDDEEVCKIRPAPSSGGHLITSLPFVQALPRALPGAASVPARSPAPLEPTVPAAQPTKEQPVAGDSEEEQDGQMDLGQGQTNDGEGPVVLVQAVARGYLARRQVETLRQAMPPAAVIAPMETPTPPAVSPRPPRVESVTPSTTPVPAPVSARAVDEEEGVEEEEEVEEDLEYPPDDYEEDDDLDGPRAQEGTAPQSEAAEAPSAATPEPEAVETVAPSPPTGNVVNERQEAADRVVDMLLGSSADVLQTPDGTRPSDDRPTVETPPEEGDDRIRGQEGTGPQREGSAGAPTALIPEVEAVASSAPTASAANERRSQMADQIADMILGSLAQEMLHAPVVARARARDDRPRIPSFFEAEAEAEQASSPRAGVAPLPDLPPEVGEGVGDEELYDFDTAVAIPPAAGPMVVAPTSPASPPPISDTDPVDWRKEMVDYAEELLNALLPQWDRLDFATTVRGSLVGPPPGRENHSPLDITIGVRGWMMMSVGGA